MRVLFTGGGGAGTQALWDLLGGRYDVHFADADARRINPIVPDSNVHQVPLASDPEFVGSMNRLCRDLCVDILVPGVDEELEQLADNRADFEPTVLLLPSVDFVRSMLDKYEFACELESAGVLVPRTRLLDDPEPWSLFPCIVKPRRGRGSRGVSVVADGRDWQAHLLAAGERASRYVAQELALGTEYSVQVVADEKEALRAVFPARIIEKRGITISAIGEQNMSVIEACERIHLGFPTSGCYNIQGILDRDRRFLPFEINPRVSTTLCLAIASGIDPFKILTSTAEDQGLVQFESGVALERFWHNSFTRPSAN